MNFFFAFLSFSCSITFSQTTPAIGLRNNTPSVYALTNARIFTGIGVVLDKGTLIVRNGVIESVGASAIPADAWVVDLGGKTIYPGFIDMWYEVAGSADFKPEGTSHWNTQVRSWYDAASMYTPDEDKVKMMRSQGFVLANAVPAEGIFRGRSALVSMGSGINNKLIVKPGVSQAMSFQTARELGGSYPTSLMGAVSLVRQTFYDTRWYGMVHRIYKNDPTGNERPETNMALEALQDVSAGKEPVFFDVTDEIDFIRAFNIASEFELCLFIRGSGHEYKRLESVKNASVPVLLPLDFPRVPDVVKPEDAMDVSLEILRHWDLAPENPGRLHSAGIEIALTASGSGKEKSFLEQLRVTVERGLDEEAALAALTSVPAKLLGIEKQFGSLEDGKVASFIVASGDLFQSETKIEEVWIDGTPFEINKPASRDVRGIWEIESAEFCGLSIEISGTESRIRGKARIDTLEISLSLASYDNHRLLLVMPGDSLGIDGKIRLSASVSKNELYGIGEMPDGRFINWKAERSAGSSVKPDDADKKDKKPSAMSELNMLYPSMEYGLESLPEIPGKLIVKNATIWSQGPSGKLENADMLVSDGIIAEVGHNMPVPEGAFVINAEGRHLTPGLVDPHLHTSIKGGVNEVGINMTPETRISDVIEPDNIWIYRLLAGGMTTANLLHGSANPVGGQDAVVKMRWGGLPGEMILSGAKPGLKLALGENVVRNSNQYPNTRMGAEQIIRDAFQAAKDYMELWRIWEENQFGYPPRRDLHLEAMAEVLKGERIIHAHAYRQDEMQMLMRLAEDMGFRIASFEHTVEGYKIADIMRDHGAGAIVWTDWSSFKVEAADAILFNARILAGQGVLTALHSDDTQLSTRMNWEAGKLLATGLDEITAMDMITINPARLIGADEFVGSLEPGKHADFVIWSGHPLSGYTHAEQTWVDGRKYFDRDYDARLRKRISNERAMLIQKAISASNGPGRDESGNSY